MKSEEITPAAIMANVSPLSRAIKTCLILAPEAESIAITMSENYAQISGT